MKDIPPDFCPVHAFEQEPCKKSCWRQRLDLAVLQADYERYWLDVYGRQDGPQR
jgi:hypothetical protein